MMPNEVRRVIDCLISGQEKTGAHYFFSAMSTGNRVRPHSWGNVKPARQAQIRRLIYRAYFEASTSPERTV